MAYTVLLTKDAARDLDHLYDYIALHDTPQNANYVLEQIEKAFSRLSAFPDRGAYPKEMLALGIREYREIPVQNRVLPQSSVLLCEIVLFSRPPTNVVGSLR